MTWPNLRAEFPITRRWAFFDHAAVAPLSLRAQQAFADYTQDLVENGDVNERRWLERIEHVRGLFGRLLNADPLDVAFIKNTSEGIGIVAEGFPWKPGDNVVIAAEEYPANQYPWLNLARRGVEVRTVPSRGNRLAIDDVAGAIDGRTRILSLSFVEYASGFRNDLDALGQLCRARGVLFFVDAIQGLGVFPMDVQRTPIDFLAADGHKWLLGPEGAGIFWIRRELVERLDPVGIGWNSVVGARNFSVIDLRLKPHAGRWESGSLNVGGISALGASLELLLEIGIDKIAERVLELTDFLCERLAQKSHLEVFSSRTPDEKSAIVSVAFQDPAQVNEKHRVCRAAGIVVNRRAGRLRVSPHCYNSEEEIDRLMALL